MSAARVFKTNFLQDTVRVEFPEGTEFLKILDIRTLFRREFPDRIVNVFGSRYIYLTKREAS